MKPMINLSDLGLESETDVEQAPAAETLADEAVASRRFALTPSSITAKALCATWEGNKIVMVDSPPGAGKTSLLIEMLDHLVCRSDFKIIVGCPTKNGAADVAVRLAERFSLEPDEGKRPVVLARINDIPQPAGSVPTVPHGKRFVEIRTVASCSYSAPECDVLVIDEAYQVTYSDMLTAADKADRVVMVGDPGQIGPVVTANTNFWAGKRLQPHGRAPEEFAKMPGARTLKMDATYRLGQETVDAIAPLYDFAFESRRPERYMVDADGDRMPELGAILVEPTTSTSESGPMIAAAEAAAEMVGATVMERDENGNLHAKTLRQRDVCVVVPHNVQVKGVRAMLDNERLDSVTVGTADSLQGGQWYAVIAIDPTVGVVEIGEHQLSPGRLCVMASRHMAILRWVHDSSWRESLAAVAEDFPIANVGIEVRKRLTA